MATFKHPGEAYRRTTGLSTKSWLVLAAVVVMVIMMVVLVGVETRAQIAYHALTATYQKGNPV